MRRAVLISLGFLSLAAPSSASAAAADDVRVVTVQRAVAPGDIADESVPCGVGERALSGGAVGSVEGWHSGILVSGPHDDTGTTINTDDFDVPRAWYSAVDNGTDDTVTPSDILFTFYAVCSASSDALVQAETFGLQGWDFATMGFNTPVGGRTVECPTGQRAVGGGLSTTGELSGPVLNPPGGTPIIGNLSAAHNGPLDESETFAGTDDGDVARAWYAQVRNGTGQDHTFKVFAICSPTSTATVQTSTIDGTSENVLCPAGESALGGGTGSSLFNSYLNFSGPGDANGFLSLAAGGQPGSWFVSLNSNPADSGYKVFVLCEARTSTPPGPDPEPGPNPDLGPNPEPGPQGSATCRDRTATIVGTDGAETLSGTPGDDVIAALGGDDRVLSSAGNDVICGGGGGDVLKGQRGTDLLLGEAGKDTLVGGAGSPDTCVGGRNRDSNAGSCEKGRA